MARVGSRTKQKSRKQKELDTEAANKRQRALRPTTGDHLASTQELNVLRQLDGDHNDAVEEVSAMDGIEDSVGEADAAEAAAASSSSSSSHRCSRRRSREAEPPHRRRRGLCAVACTRPTGAQEGLVMGNGMVLGGMGRCSCAQHRDASYGQPPLRWFFVPRRAHRGSGCGRSRMCTSKGKGGK